MSPVRLGYNTSGFARTHDIGAVARTIAACGYRGLELSFDRRHFHPDHATRDQARDLGSLLQDLGLGVVVGTGARYVLSAVRHEPSLVSAEPEEREIFLAFLERSLRVAPLLGARVAMLHSGLLPLGVEPDRAWSWLVEGARHLARAAADEGVDLAFEFHPDMVVRTLGDWQRLAARVDHPAFRLTLDVGHVACTEDAPISAVIRRCAPAIANVHLEDVRGRVHQHLPVGLGDIDFGDVFRGLQAVGYPGLVNAEFNTDDLEVDEIRLARDTLERLTSRLS